MMNPDEERMQQIDTWNTFAADFSDVAYMAFMEEKGVSIGELEAYSKWCAEVVLKEINHS